MNSFIFKPRSGSDMLKATPYGTGLFTYSELCSLPMNSTDIILSLPRKCIILLQDPRNLNSGHWISLSRNDDKKEVYYFSSYGYKPEQEKYRWMKPNEIRYSRQERDLINDGLKNLYLLGWKIYYNDFPYQVEGDRTATCGVWACAFLNSDLNPDEFANEHRDAGYYFRRYFS